MTDRRVLGNLTGKFTAISTTSLKTYIYLPRTPVSPEYAPLNHHIHLSKTFLLNVSNTFTLVFLFLNQLYKYRRLEKFTVHSLSPFSFVNVMLFSQASLRFLPRIDDSKIKLSKTSISIFQQLVYFQALAIQTKIPPTFQRNFKLSPNQRSRTPVDKPCMTLSKTTGSF